MLKTLAASILATGLVLSAHAIDLMSPSPVEVDVPSFESSPILQFAVDEGNVHNRFYQRGPVAAHMVVRSGADPRVIVAFPAGNEGVALWLESPGGPVELTVVEELEGFYSEEGTGGIKATLRADSGTLRMRRAVLGSVRVIRDVIHSDEVPPDVAHEVVQAQDLGLFRRLLDGRMITAVLEPQQGAEETVTEDGTVEWRSGGPDLRLRLTAMTQARPLTPIGVDELLQPGVEADPRDLQALAFLAYEEKLLAGSWRFLTYFGRDTLLSIQMLMPVLRHEVTEAALGSVLARMGPNGEVAHEEDIGDWAALTAERDWKSRPDGEPPDPLASETPAYDYTMVDDDFLLLPVLTHYLLDAQGGGERATAFLQRTTPGGARHADLVRLNLGYVMRRAEPYAAAPVAANLVSLLPGEETGEWRDSREGLGNGRIPYNVNVALVPAALLAAERLLSSDLLGPDAEGAARAAALAAAWKGTGKLFEVEVPQEIAEERVRAYAEEIGVDPDPALARIDGPIRFPAVALDGESRPIPVMHSDDSFLLMFGQPDAAELDEIAARLRRPFPAGLRTPVGVVVANPALAEDAELRALFSRAHYHGTVVWSWQQAMLADGLAWQLFRDDLPLATRARLFEAQRLLWQVIEDTAETRGSELWSWSWSFEDGQYVVVPFGQAEGHHSESNAAQLWSTVYIGVRPPG